MREHVQTCFPQTPFSEHSINLPLATLVGPRAVGLVVIEKSGSARRYIKNPSALVSQSG